MLKFTPVGIARVVGAHRTKVTFDEIQHGWKIEVEPEGHQDVILYFREVLLIYPLNSLAVSKTWLEPLLQLCREVLADDSYGNELGLIVQLLLAPRILTQHLHIPVQNPDRGAERLALEPLHFVERLDQMDGNEALAF